MGRQFQISAHFINSISLVLYVAVGWVAFAESDARGTPTFWSEYTQIAVLVILPWATYLVYFWKNIGGYSFLVFFVTIFNFLTSKAYSPTHLHL